MMKQDLEATSKNDKELDENVATLSSLGARRHQLSALTGQSEELSAIRKQLSLLEGQLWRQTDQMIRKNAQLSKTAELLKTSQKLLEDSRVHSKSYSFRLSQQTDEMAEKCAHISELEAQLSRQAEEISKLRRPSLWKDLKDLFHTLVVNHSTKETPVSVPAVADEHSVNQNFGASLTAFPHQVPVGKIMGATEITWNTSDDSEGEVYVSMNGEPETLFATGQLGSKEAPWILANQSYEFRLYAGASPRRLLDEVSVIGMNIPADESRVVVLGSLDPPVQDLSSTPCLQVSGWAYSKKARISWVEAFLDNVPLGLMRYGEWRSHVPTDSTSRAPTNCGFSGRFLLGESLLSPRTLLVRVADEQGNIQDLPAITFGPLGIEPAGAFSAAADDYGLWVKLFDTLTDADREAILDRIDELAFKPLISIVMPVYNVEEVWLRKAIESVIKQLYPNWELCIADDNSTQPHVRKVLEEYEFKDSRIKVKYRNTNGHISVASNSALELVTGELVALLDNDDELPEHALYMVVTELNEHPEADLIYSDEDKIDEKGVRREPHFKSDWNPDLLNSCNTISHLGVYRTAIIKKIGGFREGFEGSQDYDLVLRFSEQIPEKNIRHIPRVLYHWRAIAGSVALASGEKDYAHEAARNAIRSHLKRKGVKATVTEGNNCFHRVIYPVPDPAPLVSVIIATRDRVELLSQAVGGLLNETDYEPLELIIVDNLSKNPATLKYLQEIQKDPRVKVVEYADTFNYSAINNLGFRESSGEVIALLNNDIKVISPGWLKEMVSHALRPGIGAVGAKLLYPDGRVQHAGVILGVYGVAAHAHRFIPRDGPGYLNRAMIIQNLSAVTGACMILRREVYGEIGGLDEINLSVAFNDIDLCIRIREKGYRIVWTPYAELYHFESASRGRDDTPDTAPRFRGEVEYMMHVWDYVLKNDPYYNPNLTLIREDFSLAVPPRITRKW